MTYLNLLIIVLMLLGLCTANGQDFKIVESESGKPYDLDILTAELLNYDVVFFGELHDDSLLHYLEAEMFSRLVSQSKSVVLSMEMFERDNQIVLSNYISNKIDYPEFSQSARLWPNHETDYEPLLQIAKEYNRDVIAANIPRRFASILAREGEDALSKVDEKDKKYFAEKLLVLDDRYKTEFYETMSSMSKQGMPNKSGHDMILNIYKAQCLKDDTMAESINNYLSKNPERKVLHINGDFHSRYYLGTAQKLALLNSNLKIAVIAPVTFSPGDELDWSPEFTEAGDYLILFHRN